MSSEIGFIFELSRLYLISETTVNLFIYPLEINFVSLLPKLIPKLDRPFFFLPKKALMFPSVFSLCSLEFQLGHLPERLPKVFDDIIIRTILTR